MALDGVLIVDDFYEDPHAVRELGLRATYRVDGWSHDVYFPDDIRDRFEEMVGREITHWQSGHGNGDFLLATQHSGAKGVHTDGPRGSFGVAIYMTPDALVPGNPEELGTVFWRHGATGFTRRPTSTDLKSLHMSQGRWRRLEDAVDVWRPVGSAGYKFNRAVIFPGDIYHSTGGGFGNELSDGRLLHSYLFGTVPKN
jgi:hypothetical protein